VFRRGDCYVRSGDLFRRDADGYFYFVDRLGDAFRFKGELVATVDVESALERAGVRVSIVGVRVPSVDGKVGLAVGERGEVDFDALRAALVALPTFARPRFLRLIDKVELGPSLKLKKRMFGHDGVDPRVVLDPLYLLSADACEPLTDAVWERIASGALRL
jgi:fatty-acyl-CoA synthase